jgi:glutamine cyclotransferase
LDQKNLHPLKKIAVIFFLLPVFTACSDSAGNSSPATAPKAIPAITYALKDSLSHDTTSYTEGLLLHNGILFESTGSPPELTNTRSVAGPVDLKTGKVNAKIEINRALFGEGIVFLDNKLYQLTYRAKKGFVYDAKTFKQLDSFKITSEEGWGLTTDGTSLIMSDGTSNISYLNPANCKLMKILRVTDNEGPVEQLNELEYVNGFLYANIYTTNYIVKIDTQTGQVVGRLDCSPLDQKARARYPGALEMNGIAYDSTAGTFFVTGKFWPGIYAISFPH